MAKKKQSSNRLEVRNAAKTLFANIRFMSPDAPIKSIVLTSSIPNEGKSTVAVELARAIATSGKTVIAVEADMRRRTLASRLNIHPAAGIYSVLTEATTLNEAITQTATANLFFLDVEPNIPNPPDVLSSKSYQKLVESLRESYDYVLFDTPPVGTFIDAAILSGYVDGTMLVLKPEAAKRSMLLDAFEQLKRANANILGICATFCEDAGSEYYYAYYTEAGKRLKRDAQTPRTRPSQTKTEAEKRSGNNTALQIQKGRPKTGLQEKLLQRPLQSTYVKSIDPTKRKKG